MNQYLQNQHRLGIVLAFGALIWNGTYNALAKNLTEYLSPIPLLLLSESLTAVFIVLTFGLVPLMRKLQQMDLHTIRISIIIGLLNSAIAPLFFFAGLARTTAINASLLSSSDIICVLIAARYFLHETVSKMQIIGGAIVLAGILVINLAATGETLDAHIGDIFIIIGALISGTGSVLFKKYLSHVMPELAILIRNIAAIVAVSIVGIYIEISFSKEIATFPAHQIIFLLAFTFFSRYLNLTFFYESLDRIPATTLSLILVGSPVAGIFFASLISNEQIHTFQILGCTFIIFGLMLEQVSAQSLHALRLPFSLFHRSELAQKNFEGKIDMLPKNV